MKGLKVRVNTMVLYGILIVPFLIDQVNGFMQFELGSHFSVSQWYKAGVVLFMLVMVMLRANTESAKAFIGVSGMLIITLLPYWWGADVGEISLFKNARYNLRLLFMPISYLFFSSYWDWFDLDIQKVRRVFILILYIFGLATLFSLFGFGIPTYAFYLKTTGETIGYSGYFISTNEIGGVLLVVFSFILFLDGFVHRKLLSLGLVVLISVLIGTKTMYASVVVSTMLLWMLNQWFKDKPLLPTISISMWRRIFLFSLIGLVLVYFVFWDFIAPSVARIVHKFETHDNIINFLTSSRLTRVGPTYENWVSQANGINWLFGMGYSSFYNLNMQLYTFFGTIEIDFFDLLGIIGIMGTLFVYFFWFKLAMYCRQIFKARVNDLAVPIGVSVILLWVISGITGHIFQSSLGGILFGFVFSLNRFRNNEIISGY